MKRASRIAIFAVTALAFFGSLCPAAFAKAEGGRYPASSYLMQVNGQTVLEKDADRRLAPASLTKIMTALIVMERCRMDEVVIVSRGAARETGSRIGLRRGQRLRVGDLLAATLIASANDAYRALADHVAGNQGSFVALMNARARDLHLRNTRFANPCGHDHDALYTSAHDLAILSEQALRHPVFAELVSRRTMRIATLNGRRSFHLKNKNRLIGRYPGATGVKTGTTPRAGQCLVALAKRDNKRVLLVLLRSKNRWKAAPAMLDAAFARYSSYSSARPEQLSYGRGR